MMAGLEGEAARGLVQSVPSLTTPAGLETIAKLRCRRWLVLALNLVTWLALVSWVASILAAGGWLVMDVVLLCCAALGTPWAVVGFWNALIGLWQLHLVRTGFGDTALFGDDRPNDPITVNTAVLMTLRNEDPRRAILRLRTIKAALDATPASANFSYFVLSDTDKSDVACAEGAAVDSWRVDDPGAARIAYRRRATNEGYKAGNIRDFCTRWGRGFELMLPLDTDSLMTGEAITRLVRVMQRHPKIGILQSLVVGTPSTSPFARIFQFGMRLGMRTYTMGQTWWVGDCGPFWGHNALVRIRPFTEHCQLPALPGAPPLGGPILSHDQVEATLMRRAGYEVRVLPAEIGSYEDSPPDALEFSKRDVRWCQGNMQYLGLLGLPRLLPVSRFQLAWAIFMFLGVPAWTLMIALLPALALDAQMLPSFSSASAKALYVTFILMHLTPKLAGLLDAALTPGEMQRFGGRRRMTASALTEIVFSFLLGSISGLRIAIFMIGLPFGKSIVWSGQARDAERVTWTQAASALWPHVVFGLAVCTALFFISPTVLLWSLPLTAGYLLAIPVTVVTSIPALGEWMRRTGFAGIPEDWRAPKELRAVQKREGRAS